MANHKTAQRTLIIAFLIIVTSCNKFLDTELNNSQIDSREVFSDEANATSAISGLYRAMIMSSFAGGGANGISALTGLSSDELSNFLQHTDYLYFENNQLTPSDHLVSNLWTEAYKSIYQANDIIEGMQTSTGTSENFKKQLQGEALFSRAFCYFYLVNLFGEVPLITSTDYKANSKVIRQNVDLVYDAMITDLEKAKGLLSNDYIGTNRTRPNKAVASALLARIYLYNENWEMAEIEASEVLQNDYYDLAKSLGEVFLISSPEVIWQLASQPPYNTAEATNFIIQYGPVTTTSVVKASLLSAFEVNDLRKTEWVGAYSYESQQLNYPFKYKSATYGAPITEHYVVFRLAEQYLIRAEARAHLNKLADAISDVDEVRKRTGLLLIADTNPGIVQEDLLLAIERENRIEFFGEWGHRWFDLKRVGRASTVLSQIKPDWSADDQLYPIPQSELDQNPFLGKQNRGY